MSECRPSLQERAKGLRAHRYPGDPEVACTIELGDGKVLTFRSHGYVEYRWSLDHEGTSVRYINEYLEFNMLRALLNGAQPKFHGQ